MHLILRYPSGRLADGILLAAGSDCLRIVVRRLNETVELRLTEDQWISDEGERIEIDGWLTGTAQESIDFCRRFGRRTSTATH